MPVLRSLWLLPLRVMASARWTLRSIVAAAASLVAGDVAPAGEGQLRVRISRRVRSGRRRPGRTDGLRLARRATREH